MILKIKKKEIQQAQIEYDPEYINPFRPKVRFDLSKNETRIYKLSTSEKYDKITHWNNIKRKFKK